MIDGPAPSVHRRPEGGIAITNLWVTACTPADLSSSEDTSTQKVGIPPPSNGTIFRVVEFAPQKEITADYETRLKMIQGIGLAPEGPSRERARDPGMHRTRTVDYAVILSGEIDMLWIWASNTPVSTRPMRLTCTKIRYSPARGKP
jgi:hypothetical protein